jgi:hypothetical protein
MKSLADRLPPEIARQIHPDWRKNEAGYWSVRDQFIAQYRDPRIGALPERRKRASRCGPTVW